MTLSLVYKVASNQSHNNLIIDALSKNQAYYQNCHILSLFTTHEEVTSKNSKTCFKFNPLNLSFILGCNLEPSKSFSLFKK